VKTGFTPADVESRACQALRLALAHGIGAVRAQCDVDSFTELRSFEGLLRARDRFAGLVDIQIVAFPQEGIVADPKSPDLLREAIRMGADLVGALPEREATIEDQRRHLETVLDIAEDTGVRVDAHSDYVDDPDLKTLEMLADMTLARGLQGRVTVGHCNALAVYPDDEARRVIDKLVEASIRVIVMPMANLQMLGGPSRTPYNRGSSRTAEFLDAGIRVAAASDNMYDIWYRFNRLDPADLALFACLSGGLRTDPEVRAAFDMTNSNAAYVFGSGTEDVRVGELANLVVLNARNLVDVFRNLPGRRLVIRQGRIVAGIEGSIWVADR
jgi:cytosine/creatinine deaminase